MARTQAEKSLARLAAYRDVFESPQGKIVLNDMFSNHAILSSTFNGDVNQMLLKEGERNVVLRILKILKTDVEKFKERMEDYAKQAE